MAGFHWLAHYGPVETFKQFDGREHSSEEIDRSRLTAFTLMQASDPVVTLNLEPGQPFFYRRRTGLTPGAGRIVCHLLGSLHGGSIALTEAGSFRPEDGACWLIMGFFEDGRQVRSVGFVAGDAWLDAPVFTDRELAAYGPRVLL